MGNEDSSEKVPEMNPGENSAKFQRILRELREAGLEVIDATDQGAGMGFLGAVYRTPKG
jgi:hypothetical protein